MNLYEINEEILKCVDEETGDIIDFERLSELEIEESDKISNIACWIKDLKAEAEAIKAEKQNLEKRQKSAENKMESLKNYLAGYLGGRKFKDARCSISYRKSTSTVIDESLDVSTLPTEYQKIKIEADKTAIKKALEAGEKIDGCVLIEKDNVIIK
jgi:chaperonin cofactor prefoldin